MSYQASQTVSNICRQVTVQQAADQYGFEPNRAGYICCPFHREKTPSLKLYDGEGGWYCFGCGEGGDVIRFVMLLFDLSFPQAVLRINEDFHLGLTGTRSRRRSESAALRERREKQTQRAELEEQRRALTEEFRYWWEASMLASPKPSDNGWIHPLYVEAVKRLPTLEYRIEELDNAIWERK